MIVFVLWNDSSQTWYAKKILKMFFQIKILLHTVRICSPINFMILYCVL